MFCAFEPNAATNKEESCTQKRASLEEAQFRIGNFIRIGAQANQPANDERQDRRQRRRKAQLSRDAEAKQDCNEQERGLGRRPGQTGLSQHADEQCEQPGRKRTAQTTQALLAEASRSTQQEQRLFRNQQRMQRASVEAADAFDRVVNQEEQDAGRPEA